MAKSDSFFVRATTEFNGTTFAQSSVDLGAYVDALGKSVLRIHNIAVQWGEPLTAINAGPGSTDVCAYQLSTQSQSQMVDITNKSLIASGRVQVDGDATGFAYHVSEALDIAPQDWTNGYLVGVEQIYLGVDSTSGSALNLERVSIVLECTVETLSQAGAMALALSQQ